MGSMSMKRLFFPPILAGACVLLSATALAQVQGPVTPAPANAPTTQAPSATANGSTQTGTTQGEGSGAVGAAGDIAPATKPGQITSAGVDGTSVPVSDVPVAPSREKKRKNSKEKNEKIQQAKDSRQAAAKARSAEALVGVDSRLPDKQLYDKAVVAMNKGHFDVARLDLQTMLNTYPDSQYQMRAKLAIADSWYKEGGTAALTQAESEYADFRVFFPNAPEAAEAQMRIGDIYFRQMDRPDRDYNKAVHAEEEYRRMLTDYPDSVLLPQAKQRLREVQEVMASREADIASFYGTRGNLAAEIARYETVLDTYPLYSHLDDVLIGVGDAYEAEAKYVRSLPGLPEGGRAKLEKEYDGLAAEAYRKVVLEHSAAAHVDDAKERLEAMSLPIPVPTKEQMVASQDLENSRSSYKLTNRVELLFLHKPDTVLTAGTGEPTLTDPKAMSAATMVHQFMSDFNGAFAATPPVVPAPVAAITPADGGAAVPAVVAPAVPTAPLALSDIGNGDAGAGAAPATDLTVPATSGRPSGGNGVGIEVLSPDTSGSKPVPTGLETVRPDNKTVMAPVEAAAPAPDQVNDAAGKPTAAAQVVTPGTKTPKPEFDKADESSSKHKPKKGIKKVVPPNPF